MFQKFIGVPDAGGRLWTLAYELAFYLFISALFVARLLPRSALLYGIAVLYMFILFILKPFVRSYVHWSYDLVYGMTFLTGMIVYRCQKKELPSKWWWVVGLYIATVSGASVHHFVIEPSHSWELVNFAAVYVAAFVCFLAAVLSPPVPWSKILLSAGQSSYSAYLLHSFVIFGIGFVTVNPFLRVILIPFLTFPISYFTFRYVEVPSIAYGHRLIGRSVKA